MPNSAVKCHQNPSEVWTAFWLSTKGIEHTIPRAIWGAKKIARYSRWDGAHNNLTSGAYLVVRSRIAPLAEAFSITRRSIFFKRSESKGRLIRRDNSLILHKTHAERRRKSGALERDNITYAGPWLKHSHPLRFTHEASGAQKKRRPRKESWSRKVQSGEHEEENSLYGSYQMLKKILYWAKYKAIAPRNTHWSKTTVKNEYLPFFCFILFILLNKT